MKLAAQAGVYLIKNRVNGKVYVGSSVNLQDRFRCHKRALNGGFHESRHLQSAWNKYGESAFSFEIVETVGCVDQLLAREQAWIDSLHACDEALGYNICLIAGSPLGVRRTPETKAKLSASAMGKQKSSEHRAALSIAMKRRFTDPKQRELAAEYGRMVKPWLKGQTMPEELKRKLSCLAKERALTPEGRAQNERSLVRMRAANQRNNVQLQTKEKI